MILTVCYATGLRISEAIQSTPAAIDSQRMVIRVAEGKGRKDRYVMLCRKLLLLLRTIGAHPAEAVAVPGALNRGNRPRGLTVEWACREARRKFRHRQARHAARPAPRVCRPPSGIRSDLRTIQLCSATAA